MGKPNRIQCVALEAAALNHGVIDFYAANKLGANGRTLSALVDRGFLTKEDDRGMSLWRMTNEGHAALAAASAPKGAKP